MSSFGGNGIRLSDYNTVLSTSAQFFALRNATLRRPNFCQKAIDQGLLPLIPELALRKAVQACAAGQPGVPLGAIGADAPTRWARFVGKGTSKHSRPSGGGGGGALIAGLVLAAMAARK